MPSLPVLISLQGLCASHPVAWGRDCYLQSRLQSSFMSMWSGSLGYQIPFFMTKMSNSPASFRLHSLHWLEVRSFSPWHTTHNRMGKRSRCIKWWNRSLEPWQQILMPSGLIGKVLRNLPSIVPSTVPQERHHLNWLMGPMCYKWWTIWMECTPWQWCKTWLHPLLNWLEKPEGRWSRYRSNKQSTKTNATNPSSLVWVTKWCYRLRTWTWLPTGSSSLVLLGY